MIGADAGAQIAVEPVAAEQRAVPVDRPGLERGELGEAGRVAREQAGEIHEFGEAEHLRVVGERQEIADLEPRAGGLEMGRRHAARKLHAQVHRRRHRAVEEIAQARLAEHVGDLVRIADRGGDAVASTQRSNSSGVISEDSTWQCVSMKPGTTILPRTSISRAPRYSPIVPTMRSLQIATSLWMSSPLTRSKIRPPLRTMSASASPCPCSIARDEIGDGVAHDGFLGWTAALFQA